MVAGVRQWGPSKAAPDAVPAELKAVATAECERLVSQVFRPQYLTEIRVTEFNYPVSIDGKWRGRSFTFSTRYRSGFDDNRGEEFDAPFSRIEYAGGGLWNVGWFRHTGKWFTIERSLPLAAAIAVIETRGLLHPNI